MAEQVHGHEVMRMMLESNTPYTETTLRDAMVARFGEATRFCTCSAENMTADELIAFLRERGKFVARGEGFQTAPDRIADVAGFQPECAENSDAAASTAATQSCSESRNEKRLAQNQSPE